MAWRTTPDSGRTAVPSDFHSGVEEEKAMWAKSPRKPDPYAEDRRKQAAQLRKIQGYLHRAHA